MRVLDAVPDGTVVLFVDGLRLDLARQLEQALAQVGFLMLNERLAVLQWLAIVCVMLAAAGSSVTAGRNVPKSPPEEIMM